MERNELLKLIEEVISPCNSTYKDHRERAAKRILDVIEEAGMVYLNEYCMKNKYIGIDDLGWEKKDENKD